MRGIIHVGMLDQLKENITDIIFPRRCPLCGSVINRNERICSRCSKDVEFIRRPICRTCGRPLYTCDCRRGQYAFVRNVSPLVYTKAAKRGIRRMKFNNSPSSCTYFGKLMANVVRREYTDIGINFDCVIGVPMHSDDYRNRGYNQAALLAKIVAEELELPHYIHVLVKYRKNSAQHTLSFKERQQNIKGVFRVAMPEMIRGCTVLLCDDVTTSGSTLNECALTLLEAGAKSVYCVTATVSVLSEMPAIKAAAFNTPWL